MTELSVIVPCFNEAEHLRQSVSELLEVLDGARWSWEVIFVDDGSRDETRAVIDDLVAARTDGRLRRIFHERNTGRGGAVENGVRAAEGRFVGFLDIDLEVHARYVPSLILALEKGADLVTVRRVYKLRPWLLHRAILSRGYVWCVNHLLGTSFEDSEAGYKFFRRDRLEPVLAAIRDRGWFWDTEIMVRSERAGLRIETIPALFVRRDDKKSTVRIFHDTAAYLRNLLRFRRELRAGRASQHLPSIYTSRFLFRTAMRLLYGRSHEARYRAVADRIPDGASVVDACAGDGWLYTGHLRGRTVRYTGLENAPALVRWARRHGVAVHPFDVRRDAVPEADFVVLLGSLYQFLPDAGSVLEKLRRAARRELIVTEPVQNLSTSSNPWIASLSRSLTRPTGDDGYRGDRFDRESLVALFETVPGFRGVEPVAGGRELLAVFESTDR